MIQRNHTFGTGQFRLRRNFQVQPLRFVLLAFLFLSAPGWFVHAADWQTLEGCKLLPGPGDDADSFYVAHKGKEYIFRLYFVDAPETDQRFDKRLAEQAAYWGIPVDETFNLGKLAAKHAAEQLKDGFTVVTRWEDARGQSRLERFYALVMIGDKDLGEELVRKGLARIHGVRVDRPDGASAKDASLKLINLERDAMEQRRGAWAFAAKDVELHKVLTHRVSGTGIRHHSKCRYFATANNRPCKADEGQACKTCGG